MAKPQGKLDRTARQRSLFDFAAEASRPPAAHPARKTGSLNLQQRLREELKRAIRESDLSRWEIAGQMSDLIDSEISKYMIDAWTAESKEGHRFPAEYLPAFCRVTGSRGPLAMLAEAAGLYALPGPEALRAEIQKLDEEQKRLAAEKRKRQRFLEELEARR